MAKPAKPPEWDSGELNTVEPTATHKAQGWTLPGGVPEKPTLEETNYWMNNVYKWLAEINQVGVLSWDAVTTYAIGGYVVGSDFRLYKSLTAGNQNNDPVGDVVNWQDVLNDASALVGEIKNWPLGTVPSGFLECDGSAISRVTYADLFAELSTSYGIGDGATTFNIPDYRGELLRGWDHGAGNDPDAATRTDRGDGTVGDNVGTKQLDAMQGHHHSENVGASNSDGNDGDPLEYRAGRDGASSNINQTVATQLNIKSIDAPITDGVNGTPSVAPETRPRNVNIMYLIKY